MIFETFETEVTRCKDTCPLFFVCAERVSDRNCPKYCPGRKRDYPIDFCIISETEFEPIKLGNDVSVEAQLETVIVKFCGYGCQKGYPDAHSCECGIDSKVECEYNLNECSTAECPIYDLPSGKYEYKVNKEDIIRTGDCYED